MREGYRPKMTGGSSEVPRGLAVKSGLSGLKREVEQAVDVLEVAPETLKKHERDIRHLIDRARGLYHYLFKLRRRLDARDPEYALIEDLLRTSAKLLENLQGLAEFSERLQAKDAAGRLSSGMLTLAIRDIKRNLAELFAKIQEMEIEPLSASVGAVMEEAKARVRGNLGKIVALLVATGILATGIFMREPGAGEGESDEARVEYVEKEAEEKAEDDESWAGSATAAGSIHKKSRENTPGAISGDLTPLDKGREHDAGIEGDGAPGEFPSGRPIAKVDFSFFNDIDDPLWSRGMTAWHPDGRFRVVGSRLESSGRWAQAEVETKPMDVYEGKRTVLLTPVGFGVGEVRVEPEIDFEFNPDTRVVTFKGGKEVTKVILRYTVVKTKERLQLQSWPDQKGKGYDEHRLPHIARHLIDRLIIGSKKALEIEDALDSYFSEFIYVVSTELNEMIARMPAVGDSSDLKTAALGVGDCDTLAQHAAALLNRAGQPAAMALGLLEEDNEIDAARPHAKLVYFDKEGEMRTYETTAHTANQYVNATFKEADRQWLEDLIAEMSHSDPPNLLLEKYAQFASVLRGALERGDYEEFKAKNRRRGVDYEILSEAARRMEDADKWLGEKPEALQIIAAVLLALLAAGGIFAGLAGFAWGFGKVSDKIIKRMARRAREIKGEFSTDVLELLEREWNPPSLEEGGETAGRRDKGEAEGKEEARIDERIAEFYDSYYGGSTESVAPLQQLYPIEEVRKWSYEKKRRFLRVLGIIEMFMRNPDRGWTVLLRTLTDRCRFEKVCSRLEADGISLDKLMEAAKQFVINPKRLQEYEQKVSRFVDEVTSNGVKLAVKRIEPLERNGRASVERVLDMLGTTISGEPAAMRRPRPRMERGEFYDQAPYYPGMDVRMIDWPAYARTDKLVVKRSVDTRRERHRATVLNFLIEVSAVDENELQRLVALLLYVQRHNREVKVESITFVANGQIVGRLDERALAKLTTQREGLRSIRYLIEMVYRTKGKEAFRAFLRDDIRWNRGTGDRLRSAFGRLRPLGMPAREKFVVLGLQDLPEQFFEMRDVVVLREKKAA